MTEIIGYIERITFQSPENGYTIAKLQEKKKTELICIVGSMPTLQPGETVRCFGEWINHLVYGRQFEVKSYKVEEPADVIGIKKYLGSGLVKGIGPIYAEKIVGKFGTETLTVIDKYPGRLLEVPGIGKKRHELIISCWQEQRSIREVMIFLQGVGASPAFAQKIYKSYGQQTISKIKENPYILAKEIFGIGFKMADSVAREMGIEKNSPQRIKAGIHYVLSELTQEGHTCFPLEEFLLRAKEMLAVDVPDIQMQVEALQAGEEVVFEPLFLDGEMRPFLWLRSLFLAEKGIAKQMNRLIEHSSNLRNVDENKALEWVQQKLSITLAEHQIAAVKGSLAEKFLIITGGPGTGKSTITNAILHITEKLTSKILLAAPTGRAAKRMAEITGRPAKTIHSLLEFDFRAGGFKKGRSDPLDCDLIIIDEASMIDTQLMYNLLAAIPSNARVIFVGDTDQLPSVGPGNVLKDAIMASKATVFELKEIFRQAKDSKIIVNAHRINKGIFPKIENDAESDFFFLSSDEPETVLGDIVALVKQRLPTKYHLHPINQIQVLAPMRRGVIGTENLNKVLQEALNPQREYLERYGKRLAIHDKVMQIRNNYQKEVFNGDVGSISCIDSVDQKVYISFEGVEVEYEYSELDEIVLAYAVSVHKYQGSECPCIVMPVHTQHFKMLHRNLLYTGVTRGKQLVVLIGTKKALSIAINNDEVMRRYTGLQQTLLDARVKI
ncbi:MAG: ATP-dependent RecD-like DNA helicase [Waddliaceae bacterium]